MRVHEKASDADLLAILDMVDEGVSAAGIAKLVGGSRNSILGKLHRIRVDLDDSERLVFPADGFAEKPENRDGGMPARWWVAGLARQKGRAA